jgi:hypothetical protein
MSSICQDGFRCTQSFLCLECWPVVYTQMWNVHTGLRCERTQLMFVHFKCHLITSSCSVPSSCKLFVPENRSCTQPSKERTRLGWQSGKARGPKREGWPPGARVRKPQFAQCPPATVHSHWGQWTKVPGWPLVTAEFGRKRMDAKAGVLRQGPLTKGGDPAASLGSQRPQVALWGSPTLHAKGERRQHWVNNTRFAL